MRERVHQGSFLLSQPSGQRCFDRVPLDGIALVAGELVAKVGDDYVAFDPDGSDGSEQPVGIAFGDCDATDSPQTLVMLVRGAELNAACLAWPEGISNDAKSAALGYLGANTGLATRGAAVTQPDAEPPLPEGAFVLSPGDVGFAWDGTILDQDFDDGVIDLSAATAIVFDGVTRVNGNVYIFQFNEPLVTSLDFAELAEVTGDFDAEGMDAVMSVDLSSLTTVGGYFLLYQLPGVASVDLSALVSTGNDCSVEHVESMTTVDMSSLVSVGRNFGISESAVVNAPSFPSLTTVGGSITFLGNAQLTSIPDFLELTSCGGLHVSNNPLLTALPNFPQVTEFALGQNFVISGNAALNGGEFGSLVSASNGFLIQENAAMITAPSFPVLEDAAAIFIRNNPAMTTIPPFPALKSAGSLADFSGNALSQATVDLILETFAALDGTGGTTAFVGTVDLSGGTNATPGAAGLIAKATLEGRGCSVPFNS